jgi:uncharacterized SAM-binding protein YcdF (DUF218 family)
MTESYRLTPGAPRWAERERRVRSVTTELVHLAFSLPFYVLLVVLLLLVKSFRAASHSRLRRLRPWLAAALLLGYLVSVPALPTLLVRHLEHATPWQPDAVPQGRTFVVVLSGGWFRRLPAGYEVKLGAMGLDRVETGMALWRRHGGTLVFSGAPVPDGKTSVAAEMALLAERLGMPKHQMVVEGRSQNTRENLLFTRDLLSLTSADTVYLVTSAVHMPRALGVARQLGVNALARPCDFRADENLGWTHWLPSNEAPRELEEAFHEIAGLAAYRWRGWLATPS